MRVTAESVAKALNGKKQGNGWTVCCPAHNDKNPSCSLNTGPDGKILIHCHAGCTSDAVVAALKAKGLWPEKEKLQSPPFVKVADYFYEDELGRHRLRIDRLENAFDKIFRQYHWNGSEWRIGRGEGTVAPYRYAIWKNLSSVVLVEGEKAVLALEKAGVNYATCIPGGSKAWDADYVKYFKGKHVAVLPDNDVPGVAFAEEVVNSLIGESASVRMVKLSGLREKQDVVDWIALGGTIDKLRDAIKSTPALTKKLSAWRSVADDLVGEKERRKQQSSNKISFGVNFLDRAFSGIMPHDLVLVGAKTGAGKTEIVTSIAYSAIHQMKRVYQFALEAEDGEITSRLKYRILANKYYSDPRYGVQSALNKINYVDWYEGAYDATLAELESEVEKQMRFELENYNVIYRSKADFTAVKLISEIEGIKDDADLIIIDHFHYLDFEDENENRAQGKAASMIRDISLRIGKPIILVGHIRKSDRRNAQLVPDIEDFHGSSNLGKICTKAFMIGPAPSFDQGSTTLFKTLVRISKMRRDNSRTRYTGLITFDIKTNSYESQFQLVKLKKEGTEAELITDPYQIPFWAKGK